MRHGFGQCLLNILGALGKEMVTTEKVYGVVNTDTQRDDCYHDCPCIEWNVQVPHHAEQHDHRKHVGNQRQQARPQVDEQYGYQ